MNRSPSNQAGVQVQGAALGDSTRPQVQEHNIRGRLDIHHQEIAALESVIDRLVEKLTDVTVQIPQGPPVAEGVLADPPKSSISDAIDVQTNYLRRQGMRLQTQLDTLDL